MELPPSPIFMKMQNESDVPVGMMLGLEEAFRIISDSPTAKKVVEQAVREGVELVYDPDQGRGLMASAGYHPLKNTIFVSDFTDDPLLLALTLTHEARHAGQIKSSGLMIDSVLTPETMLKTVLAVEADARVYELKTAFELAALKDKDGAPRHPDSLDALLFKLREFPEIEKIVQKGANHPETLENGNLMAQCFREFYNSAWLRESYEEHTLLMIKSFPDALANDKMYTRELTSADIMKLLISPDMPYVRDCLKDVDLDDRHYASVRKETALSLEFMKAVRGQQMNYKKEPGWEFRHVYKVEPNRRGRQFPPSIRPPGR